MLIRNVELEGEAGVDVRIRGGVVHEIGRRLPHDASEPVFEARGGALLPGLYDHHIHLYALAASRASVDLAGADADRSAVARSLQAADAASEWIRAVNYHESAAGDLDRESLDALRADTPVRVQHRSGQAWFLNSKAIEAVTADLSANDELPDGAERDADGQLTGRFFRCDTWLRDRIPAAPPSLARVSADLASYGVCGVTDATETNAAREYELFSTAVARGELVQKLTLMGTPELSAARARRTGAAVGAVKIVLDERALPSFDTLLGRIDAARKSGRAVAVHCVTKAELALAVGAIEHAGAVSGDRIEHGGVLPPDWEAPVAALGLTVVTQPSFIRERGDRYLVDVDPGDRPWLYRCAGLDRAGIRLAGSTDAPYASEDPWAAMRTAVDRRTATGSRIGGSEEVTPDRALAMFCGATEDPGGTARRIKPGSVADLCLLSVSWKTARDRLDARDVRLTIADGLPIAGT